MRKLSRATCIVVVAGLCSVLAPMSPVSAQKGTGAPGSVMVGGDVPRPFSLTLADLKAMPRTRVTLMAEGRSTSYEGVLLAEVLTRAGAPLARDLSGPALASYVLASASDGYQALFALAEADPALTGSELIVADSVDGRGLPEQQGPMRLVAPHDKRAARSVRMLERIEVVRLRR